MSEEEKVERLVEILKRLLKHPDAYIELEEDSILVESTIGITDEEAELLEDILDD